MLDVVNSLTRQEPNTQAVWGFITYSTGTPSITLLSGDPTVDQPNVTIADTNTGVVTFTITVFGGLANKAIAFGNATTAGDIVTWGAPSYSGDTLTIVGSVTDSTATPADDNFSFMILAF